MSPVDDEAVVAGADADLYILYAVAQSAVRQK